MAELPFIPFTNSLKDVLRKDFIKSCSVWLLGEDESSLLAQAAKSNWETALGICFLAEARGIFIGNKEEESLCNDIEFRSVSAARWLLSKKTVLSTEYICWEKVTWDTAVVIRALLTAVKNYPDRFSGGEKRQINDNVVKATRWLFKRFKEWEKEVKFPFGPCDVAQILTTIIYIKEQFPRLSQEIFTPDDDVTVAIVEYLLRIRDRSAENASATETQTLSYWIDFFNSAEVIESLATFYHYCKQQDATTSCIADELCPEIEKVYIETCRYFENGQIDGRWGAHADTCRVLYSYIKTSVLMPIVVPEPHLVFKALRWMCDEKQFFSDGSFLHTMFITIFFYSALLQVSENWPLSNKTVQEIYDDIVWVSPVRTSPERSKRLAAELKNRELDGLNEMYLSKIDVLQERISGGKKILTKFLLTIGTAIAFLAAGNLIGIVSFGFSSALNPGKIDDFYSCLTLYVTIGLALLGLIWNYDRIFKVIRR